MAGANDRAFKVHAFTDEELAVAATFTTEQLKYLETLLGTTANEKINISYAPGMESIAFVLMHEYLRGQLDILNHILAEHERLEDAKRTLLQAAIDNQTTDN